MHHELERLSHKLLKRESYPTLLDAYALQEGAAGAKYIAVTGRMARSGAMGNSARPCLRVNGLDGADFAPRTGRYG
jgi:hypothetical protein